MINNNYQGKNSNSRNNYNRTPREDWKFPVSNMEVTINKENYVDEAQKAIERLITKYKTNILTTSKIRKLLSMLSNIYIESKRQKDKGDILSEDIKSKIQYFKLHFIYEAGREKTVKDFLDEADIIRNIDKINGSKEKLVLFCHYMEALVAYRKFSGKDQ